MDLSAFAANGGWGFPALSAFRFVICRRTEFRDAMYPEAQSAAVYEIL